MRSFIVCAMVSAFAILAGADVVSNKVMTVDQFGRNNAPTIIASVARQTSNEVAVVAAAAAAEASVNTARAVTNAIQDVVASIMANNLVVYSYGNVDSFSVAVSWDETDEIRIIESGEYRFSFEKEGSTLTVHLPYMATKNLGALKPMVVGMDSLASGGTEEVVPEAQVTTPISIPLPDGMTGYGYYLTATIYNVTGSSYFFKFRLNPDAPSGDGSTFDLPNGIKDGVTAEIEAAGGWPRMVFVGGVLKEVGGYE